MSRTTKTTSPLGPAASGTCGSSGPLMKFGGGIGPLVFAVCFVKEVALVVVLPELEELVELELDGDRFVLVAFGLFFSLLLAA